MEIEVGTKIRIIHLEGENEVYDGREGIVGHIDSIGQLWGHLGEVLL